MLALQGTSKSIPEEELDLQSISSSIKVNKNVAILAQIYEKDCKNYFDSLSKVNQFTYYFFLKSKSFFQSTLKLFWLLVKN